MVAGLCSDDGDSVGSGSSAGGGPEDDTARAIDKLLSRPWRLRRRIGRLFRHLADGETELGEKALSPKDWPSTAAALAGELGLPESLFSNGAQLFERFDFDGDGILGKYEYVKLVKYVLRQRRKELGGPPSEGFVPVSSLKQEGYTVLRELGRGGQGAMYLCSKSMVAHQYCVKIYDKKDANACGLGELIDEYMLMKNLASEYIAQTYHVFQDRDFFYLINEPYFGGDLTKLARRAVDQNVRMSEGWWRSIFKQCLSGLEYLHRKAIMHCDIKEPNIMIASGDSYESPRPVLIDFGLSVPFSNAKGGISGTPGYIPPETWELGHWYPSGDVYSLGITFFQLMVGQVPTATGSKLGILQPAADPELLRKVGLRPVLPWHRFPQAMPGLADLVQKMTAPVRYQRPRAPQCMVHPWFASHSDEPLPEASLRGLLGSSIANLGQESLVHQLMRDNNLAQLRQLRHDDGGSSSPAGMARLKKLKSLFKKHGFHQDSEQNSGDKMRRVLDDAIWAKSRYSDHLAVDLFRELDRDGNGRLSPQELSSLLNTESFQCEYHDVDELLRRMGPFDRDGCISFERFREEVIKDGRIARRAEVEGRGGCSVQ